MPHSSWQYVIPSRVRGVSVKLSILYVGESSFVFLALLIPAGHGLCCDAMEE